jgi:hypothetical protein
MTFDQAHRALLVASQGELLASEVESTERPIRCLSVVMASTASDNWRYPAREEARV